jgi:glycerophosphoryl diester phosphodiesterase
MLVFAHRGYHAHAPENTLAAFDAAAALGVDGIETDVRLSADRLPVLFHDRVAPDGREVAELTHAQLSAAAGYPVPTLDFALERHGGLTWMLEVKVPEAIEATAALVQRYATSRRLILTSFWHNVVEELTWRTAVDCGVLICHRPIDTRAVFPGWPEAARRVGAIVWCWEFVDEDVLDQAARLGLRNYAYALHTERDHGRALLWPIDGIITDYPELLLSRRLASRG